DAARLAIAGVGRDASPSLQGRLRELGEILDKAETELRRLSHELRPIILDDLGLIPALQVLAEGISRRSGVIVEVDTCLKGRPSPNVETALYRIVQEALTNVVRHARASNVRIQLARDAKGALHCGIRDDGAGFDVVTLLSRKERGGLGLIGIRERLNALDAARELKKNEEGIKIVLLTRHDEPQYVTEALRAGVKGYVLKNQAATDLVAAIQQVGRGGVYLSPNISRAVMEAYVAKT